MDDLMNERAGRLVEKVDTLMNSKSGIQKWELHDSIRKDWFDLSCEDRKTVGLAIEKLSETAVKNQKDTPLTISEFRYKDGEITELVFFRERRPNVVRLKAPFENCSPQK